MKEMTQALLAQSISYDPDTGICLWIARPSTHFVNKRSERAWNAKYPGQTVGHIQKRRGVCYMAFSFLGKVRYLHRAIWLLMTGEQADTVDHINGNGLDNRFENLRSVTLADNLRNRSASKSGEFPLGIWRRPSGKFVSRIGSGESGRKIYLGTFSTLEEATLAREKAQRELGYHKNHGAR